MNVFAGDAGEYRLYPGASHPLGVLHCLLDGTGRFLYVRYDATPQTGRARLPYPENPDGRVPVADRFRDNSGGFRGAYVKPSDYAFNVH
jgi:hypothetical protein